MESSEVVPLDNPFSVNYVMGVVARAQAIADRLSLETNVHLEAQKSRPHLAVALLGAKTIHALVAVEALAPRDVDDQLAIIGRAQAETSLDLFYLLTDTTRMLKKDRSVRLTAATKVELFLTHPSIHHQLTVGETNDILRAGLEGAIALRRSLGLRADARTWHCTHVKQVMDELEVETGLSADLKARRFVYSQLSSHVHSTAYLRPYLRWKGLGGMHRDAMIAVATLDAAIESLSVWSSFLGKCEWDAINALSEELQAKTLSYPGPRTSEGAAPASAS